MGKNLYVGVGGKARKRKAAYIGISGKARKIKKIYVGVGGKARLVYQSYVAVSGINVSFSADGQNLTVNVSVSPSNATNHGVSFSLAAGAPSKMYISSSTSSSCVIYGTYNRKSRYTGDLTITASDGIVTKYHIEVYMSSWSHTKI